MNKLHNAVLEILDMLDMLRVASVRAKCRGGDDPGSALWDREDRDIEKRIAVLRARLEDDEDN